MLLLCTYFKSSSRRTPTKTLNSSSSSFLFLFQTKGHRLGFEIRKKNLGYRNPKISLFGSVVVVVVVKKCLRDLSLHFEKKRHRANTPPVPFASSNPTAETLVVRRDSTRTPFLFFFFFFFLCPPEGGVFGGGPFQSRRLRCRSFFVSGAISLFNLSREKKKI